MPVRSLNAVDFAGLAAQILQTGNNLRFQASGRSMLPFIQDGDVLEVEPASRKKLMRGDIVLLQAGSGRLLAHRIIKTRSASGTPSFLIKGDARLQPDGWFGAESILGVIISLEHNGERVNLTTQAQRWKSRAWYFLIPLAPITACFPTGLRRYIQKILLQKK